MEKMKMWTSALIPLILLAILLFSFVKFGPLGVFKGDVPPIENIFIQRTIFSPEHIRLEIINDGPEPVTVAQVLVNNVYWQFEMSPGQTLAPLKKATIELDYPWVEGEAEHISLMSRNGVLFNTEVEAAVLTPIFNVKYFKTFILLGLYAGVIPVFLGLLWLPFLKRIKDRWYNFLLSLTIGLLVFLGFDALSESFDLLDRIPHSFNGTGLIVIGFFLAILILSAISYKSHHIPKTESNQALVWAYLISLGIGLHNLGEGLAIGSAYALGEIALGSALVIGFMIHNITEGVAIISPLTKSPVNKFMIHLSAMGLLAGAPTIIGALLAGFSYSPTMSIFFLAIGAGAIFDVAFDISGSLNKGSWISLFAIENVLGFFAGLLIMYATGLFVLA